TPGPCATCSTTLRASPPSPSPGRARTRRRQPSWRPCRTEPAVRHAPPPPCARWWNRVPDAPGTRFTGTRTVGGSWWGGRPPPSDHGGAVLQHLRHEGGDGGALGAGERDVREQRVALEHLDHGRDAVMPAHAQVVALGDVVGEHHLGVLPDAG